VPCSLQGVWGTWDDGVAQAEQHRVHVDVYVEFRRILLQELHVRPAVPLDQLTSLRKHAGRRVHRDHTASIADGTNQVLQISSSACSYLQHVIARPELKRVDRAATGPRQDQEQRLAEPVERRDPVVASNEVVEATPVLLAHAGSIRQELEPPMGAAEHRVNRVARPGKAPEVFEGFQDVRVDVGEVVLRVRHGGDGPPVLLVHGHPRTGATWHKVAPRLVEAGFTVVCPDMRGYGQSGKAAIRPDHSQQSKRAVAGDLVRLMNELGHPTFSIVGHDRGCYVALRAALDHPDVISRLVVLDGVPISEALARCDAKFAHDWYHWFFFAQPDKPERAILADPVAWYTADPERMGADNYQEWLEAIEDPDTVRAMIEDYRAGLTIDNEHELADRAAGRKVRCPTLFLWSSKDDMEDLYGDPLAIWKSWADDVRGASLDSGHHVAEENPAALSEALVDFLS